MWESLAVIFFLIYIYRKIRERLSGWDMMEEKQAEKDEDRSAAVKRGKHIEQIVPIFDPNFRGKQSVRFLGSPIDYVVFDENGEVTFIEVKTGQSTLSRRQARIKEAIENGRVYWRTVRVK